MTGTTTAIQINARAWMRGLARDIVMTRSALRHACAPELVRTLRCQLVNLVTTWRMLRRELSR